jgi:hypothetical protein
MAKDSLVPAEGGAIMVLRGFGFAGGPSEGCGGGVERSMSSRRTYVPIMMCVNGGASYYVGIVA